MHPTDALMPSDILSIALGNRSPANAAPDHADKTITFEDVLDRIARACDGSLEFAPSP